MERPYFVITGVLESIERDEAKSLIGVMWGKVAKGNVMRKQTTWSWVVIVANPKVTRWVVLCSQRSEIACLPWQGSVTIRSNVLYTEEVKRKNGKVISSLCYFLLHRSVVWL